MALSLATALIGGALIGGASSVVGASKAAKAAKSAQNTATSESQRQFDLVRADTAPLRQIGVNAIDRLSQIYGYGTPSASTASLPTGYFPAVRADGPFGAPAAGVVGEMRIPETRTYGGPTPGAQQAPDLSGFFASPDYTFNLQEGQKAIDRSAAARGGLLSGAAVKAGTRFASGLASREFSSYVDRLMQQAGLGTTGIGASASAGANTASNVTSAALNAGNTRASAYQSGWNGINNAVQGGLQNYLLSKYLTPGVA